MGKYNELAKTIIANVGGVENINGLTHCITRLRFSLKDDTKANDSVLKATDGVVTVMRAAGQVQVVIGNHVPQVFEDVTAITGVIEGGVKVKLGIFDRFVGVMQAAILPFIGVMCAGGMIRGFNALFNTLGWYESTSGTYLILNAIGEGVFYFMPIFIGYNMAKKWNVNPMVGLALGAILVFPAIQESTLSAAAGEAGPLGLLFGLEGMEYYTTFLGIPVVAGNYSSTLIPVILIVFLASYVQKLATKVVPDILKNFFVPLFTLLISMVVGLLVIGPVVGFLTSLLTDGIMQVFNFSPVLVAVLIGGTWQILVMFGIHMAVIPIVMMNFGTLGYDQVMLGQFPASFVITGVCLALYFKTKDLKEKGIGIGSVVSGIFGITEPGMYGMILPRKKPFWITCIVAGIAGGVFGLLGGATYLMGGLGIFGFPSFIKPDTFPAGMPSPTDGAQGMINAMIAAGVGLVLGFLATWFFYREKSQDAAAIESVSAPIHPVTQDQVVIAPVQGKVIPLNEVKDQAFAEGLLGKGVAIEPTKGEVVAPFDGEITAFFPTLHAIGITSSSGLELLIHVGLDTVKLEGKYFQALAKEGDNVKQGQPLLKFDIAGIQNAGYSTQVPIIVTNTPAYTEVIPTRAQIASKETELITALL
jgi:PTS system beta-glucosides-specific IIC component